VNQFCLVFSLYDKLYSIINVQIVYSIVNHGTVLLFDDVSLLMVGSLLQPTTPKSPSTTRLRMLPQPTRPRLQLISIPKRTSTTPNLTSTTLPRCTQPNWGGQVLRSPDLQHSSCSFILRNWNTTPKLQFATAQLTLHLDTMTKPPTTTPKRPHITHPRTLPQFTTRRDPSITLLQATTKLRLRFTTTSHRVLQPNGKYYVFTWNFVSLFFSVG
jgi:hypothetical protein